MLNAFNLSHAHARFRAENDDEARERRLELLTRRLPSRMQEPVRQLRQPSAR